VTHRQHCNHLTASLYVHVSYLTVV